MKKIPQPVEPTTDLPVIPGTEKARSLGELMREAESTLQQSEIESGVQAEGGPVGDTAQKAAPARRSKRPSRAQSRRFARERALQALYQWDVSSESSTTIRREFLDNQDMGRVDVEYFQLIFDGVSKNPQPIDDYLEAHLDRPIGELDPIERAVLRIATFELSSQPELPARVAINEGIEITKRFGADNGHRYINGVLDKLALALRPLEMGSRGGNKAGKG